MSVASGTDSAAPDVSPSLINGTPTSAIGRLQLILKLASRELRSGLSGFGVLIACIALGVGVITAVGALADALLDGFAREGRVLLGGDVALNRVHQRATQDERARMEALGRVGEIAVLRSMARAEASDDRTLIEIKGVGPAYPLIGQVVLESGGTIETKLARPDAVVVQRTLLDRLQLSVGDQVQIGGTSMTITDVLREEPDKLAARMPFGPRVMMSVDALLATGLVQPGTLINWRYAIAFPNGVASD
ncbi:MAG: ABC transporter permease, partial [Pseudomonadota bacterium]